MTEHTQSVLPQGWVKTTLGSVCDILAGYGFPAHLQGKSEGDLPFFKVGDISKTWKDKKTYLTTANNYLSYVEAKALKATPFPSETTVFAKIGAAIALNRRAMLGQPSLVDNNVMGLHSNAKFLNAKYVFYFSWTLKLDELSRSTTVPSIRKTDVAAIIFPLPPYSEQQRIIDEIEKQFSRLDAAVDVLQRVERNLDRLRKGTLKTAVEGALVPSEAELARAERRDYESADVSLQRMLRERRAKWELDQLAKMREQGKAPKDDKWKAKYDEPVQRDISRLPSLNEGWTWATVEQLAAFGANSITDGPFGSNLKTEHYTTEGPRVIRLQNIGDGVFNDETAHISRQHFEKLLKHRVKPNDIVIAALGETLPRACIVPAYVGDAIVKADCIRVEPNSEITSSKFLNISLNSEPTRQRTASVVHGVGRPRLNLGEIKSIVLPLPPLSEQRRIITEVEHRISVIEALKTLVVKALRRASILRQKILEDAFAGRLILQDSADEPAHELLEKIRAERAQRDSDRKGRTKGEKTMKRKGKPQAAKRRDLVEVLKEANGSVKPEELFSGAGYKPDEIEQFYADLKIADIAGALDEQKQPSGSVYLKARL